MSSSAEFESLHEIFTRANSEFDSSPTADIDPSLSPLQRRMIFLDGAPHSGATWLQQLRVAHPDVAAAGESHLFCEGLASLFDNYADPDSTMKLSTWISETDLRRLARQFADAVYESGRSSLGPMETRVLDKTPSHVPYATVLAAVCPDTAFVHLLRDGRGMASALSHVLQYRPMPPARLGGQHLGRCTNHTSHEVREKIRLVGRAKHPSRRGAIASGRRARADRAA